MSFRNKFTLKAEGSVAPYFYAKMDGVRGSSETRFGEEAFLGIKCKHYIHMGSKLLSAYLACVAGICVTKTFVVLLGKCAGNYLNSLCESD